MKRAGQRIRTKRPLVPGRLVQHYKTGKLGQVVEMKGDRARVRWADLTDGWFERYQLMWD